MRRLLILAAMLSLWVGNAFGSSGACLIVAMKQVGPDYRAKEFTGDQAGLNSAASYVGTAGTIDVYSGCSNLTVPSLGDSVILVMRSNGTVQFYRGGTSRGTIEVRGSATIPRIGPPSFAGIGGAIRIVDGKTFPQTGVGIQSAIDDCPNDGCLVIVPGKSTPYDVPRVSGHGLSVKSNVWVMGSGGSTVIQRSDTTTYNVFQNATFVGTPDSNITFSDMVIDGKRASGTGGAAIRFTNVRNGTIERVKMMNTESGALLLYGTTAGPRLNRNIKLLNSKIDGSDDSGMDIADVDGFTIQGCDVMNTGHVGINVEPRNDAGVLEEVRGVRIIGNYVAASALPAGVNQPFGININGMHNGTFDGVIDGATVTGNTVIGWQEGIDVRGPNLHGVVVSGNTVKDALTHGICVGINTASSHLTKNALFIGNHVYNCGTASAGTFAGIADSNAVNCSFIGNEIIDTNGSPNHKYGIWEKGASSAGNFYFGNLISGYTTAAMSVAGEYTDPAFHNMTGSKLTLDSLRVNGVINIVGTVGAISTSSTGNNINMSRPGNNYLTANGTSGSALNLGAGSFIDILKLGDGNTALFADSLRINRRLMVIDTLRVSGREDHNHSVIFRQDADIASAATIAIGIGNYFAMTGTTTVTDVTGPVVGTKKIMPVTFIVTTALQFTSGNHLKLNGNFVGNGTGNSDLLSGYWDGTDFHETTRVIP